MSATVERNEWARGVIERAVAEFAAHPTTGFGAAAKDGVTFVLANGDKAAALLTLVASWGGRIEPL